MFERYLQQLFAMVVILSLALLAVWLLGGILPMKWGVLGLAGLLVLVFVPLSWAIQDGVVQGLRKELTETGEAYRTEKCRAEDAERFIKSFVRPEHVTANLGILHKAYLDAIEEYRAAVVKGGDRFALGIPEPTAPQAILKFRNELYELENQIGRSRNDLVAARRLSEKMGFKPASS